MKSIRILIPALFLIVLTAGEPFAARETSAPQATDAVGAEIEVLIAKRRRAMIERRQKPRWA